MFKQCYFISYFSDYYRVERRSILKEAVRWAKAQEFDITIIASNWIHEDYWHFPKCEVIAVPKRLPPAHMRNIALSMFYGTDDEWCIILDDDTWIETGDDIIRTLRTRRDFGSVYALSVEDEVDTPIVDKRHVLRQCEQTKSGVFIIRQGLGVYFNPAYKYYNDLLLYGEDLNFMARCCYAGKDFRIVANSQTNLSRSRKVTPSVWHSNEKFFTSERAQALHAADFTPPRAGIQIINNEPTRLKAPSIYWEKL